MECDLCRADDAKWHHGQLVIYCDRPACVAKADEIADRNLEDVLKAQHEPEPERPTHRQKTKEETERTRLAAWGLLTKKE